MQGTESGDETSDGKPSREIKILSRSKSGNIRIFITLDHYTKIVFLKAVKKLSADVVVKYMRQELLHTFGVPKTVFSDNGIQFKSESFRTLMRENRVTQV